VQYDRLKIDAKVIIAQKKTISVMVSYQNVPLGVISEKSGLNKNVFTNKA